MSMWVSYRKRFVPTQIAIALTIVALYWYNRKYAGEGDVRLKLVVYFGVLQVCAVLGAWWGTRLARKIQKQSEKSPLDK